MSVEIEPPPFEAAEQKCTPVTVKHICFSAHVVQISIDIKRIKYGTVDKKTL